MKPRVALRPDLPEHDVLEHVVGHVEGLAELDRLAAGVVLELLLLALLVAALQEEADAVQQAARVAGQVGRRGQRCRAPTGNHDQCHDLLGAGARQRRAKRAAVGVANNDDLLVVGYVGVKDGDHILEEFGEGVGANFVRAAGEAVA